MNPVALKYEGKITAIGPLVDEFLEAGILVFFGQNAPEELQEFSIIHDGQHLNEDVTVGDWFCFEDERYQILAVGELANTNLGNLGHLIVKFNGLNQPEMPGDVCVEAKPIPKVLEGYRFWIETE